MQQELDEPCDPDVDDVGSGTRKQFLQKSLALWKQKRSVGPPSVLGASSVSAELDLLTQHWQPLKRV
eukprot:4232588-Amphidinium_carterae.2